MNEYTAMMMMGMSLADVLHEAGISEEEFHSTEEEDEEPSDH